MAVADRNEYTGVNAVALSFRFRRCSKHPKKGTNYTNRAVKLSMVPLFIAFFNIVPTSADGAVENVVAAVGEPVDFKMCDVTSWPPPSADTISFLRCDSDKILYSSYGDGRKQEGVFVRYHEAEQCVHIGFEKVNGSLEGFYCFRWKNRLRQQESYLKIISKVGVCQLNEEQQVKGSRRKNFTFSYRYNQTNAMSFIGYNCIQTNNNESMLVKNMKESKLFECDKEIHNLTVKFQCTNTCGHVKLLFQRDDGATAGYTTNVADSQDCPPEQSQSLPTWVIALLVVGIAIGICIILICVYLMKYRRGQGDRVFITLKCNCHEATKEPGSKGRHCDGLLEIRD